MLKEDLFNDIDNLPDEVQIIIENFCADDSLDYEEIKEFLKEIEAVGYTFDYGLDAVPYNLRKL